MTDEHSFRKPNLEPVNGLSPEAYVSVRADRSTIGINRRARWVMGAQTGKHLHFALDRTGTLWIGIVDETTGQSEPQIRDADPGLVVSSRLMARHMLDTLEAVPDEAVRFYLTGERAVDPETKATLYQLSPDKSEADLCMMDFDREAMLS